MKRFPSGVQKYTPLARATGIGSTAPCTAHSKIVCFFVSAMISSPVIVRVASRRPRLPSVPVNVPPSTITRPRETTVSVAPVTSRPSYGL